jgi:poly(hydroxyalkanoate) depolymerase family esterase
VSAVVLATASIAPAVAGWNASPQTLERHPTWIYTPATALPDGKHPLLIVLHGCNQSHTELKSFGNLVPTAEANGIVVAVPFVGSRFFGNDQQKCWDYNGATDSKGHAAELVALAKRLKADAALQIEPRHVYIVGLSSGAAMALMVGCKAPDVFAGIGAVAGPSVSSSQFSALTDASGIPPNNVAGAIAKCKSLAGSKASHFATQIANIAYGDMDRNGPQARFDFSAGDTAHAGQYRVVSIKWSQDNVQVLQSLYGAGSLDAVQAVQGGLGSLQVAKTDAKPRVSLLVAHDVGHAWAAGSGRPNSVNDGGRWIAQSGLDYAEFVVGWLISHNPRVAQPGVPELSLVVEVNGRSLNVSGTAKDPDGSIAGLATELLKGNGAGTFLQVDNHPSVTVDAAGSYSDHYDNLPDGRYKLRVTATDNTNRSTTEQSPERTIGTPPPLDECRDFTDNNFNQVARGRARLCSFAFVCAKGSGDNLGLFNVAVTSTVRQTNAEPGVFRKGTCPQP